MKTICNKVDNKSIHLFNDEYHLEKKDNKIFILDENQNLLMSISDANLHIIYENISSPNNWCPQKYKYTQSDGWTPCLDWSFPYESVFETLLNKHLQLVMCLEEKSIIDSDDLKLLSESKTLEESIKKYKKDYEGFV